MNEIKQHSILLLLSTLHWFLFFLSKYKSVKLGHDSSIREEVKTGVLNNIVLFRSSRANFIEQNQHFYSIGPDPKY